MSDSSVRVDVLQPLDARLDPSPQVTFDHELLNFTPQQCNFVLRQILDSDIGGDPGLLDDLTRARVSNPEDVGQPNHNTLVIRQVYTGYPRHTLPLALSLLVLGIPTDDLETAESPDHFALRAHFLY